MQSEYQKLKLEKFLRTCSKGTFKIFPLFQSFFNFPLFPLLYFPLPHPRDFEILVLSSGASLTSWGEGASLALVRQPSSDGVTIKMPYWVDVLHRPALHPIFSYWVG